jgi:hypothetical protein
MAYEAFCLPERPGAACQLDVRTARFTVMLAYDDGAGFRSQEFILSYADTTHNANQRARESEERFF